MVGDVDGYADGTMLKLLLLSAIPVEALRAQPRSRKNFKNEKRVVSKAPTVWPATRSDDDEAENEGLVIFRHRKAVCEHGVVNSDESQNGDGSD